MLEFDDKKHAILFCGKSTKLPPLSYRLLEALAEAPEHVYPAAELIDKIWVNNQVSPETLKQRVFVLRKALDDAGISGLSIQAVRGEGYRLLITVSGTSMQSAMIEAETSALDDFKRNFRGLTLLSISSALALILATFWFFIRSPDHTINNRILLWSNVPSENMPIQGRTVFESWRTLIADENQRGQLQLIFSDRVETMLVPVQARKDRAGLISNFELLDTFEGNKARLSIIEPRTATVLRSDLINLSNQEQVKQVLYAQSNAISELIFSHRLCLTKSQRENSQAPIWQELRSLANQS